MTYYCHFVSSFRHGHSFSMSMNVHLVLIVARFKLWVVEFGHDAFRSSRVQIHNSVKDEFTRDLERLKFDSKMHTWANGNLARAVIQSDCEKVDGTETLTVTECQLHWNAKRDV